MPSVRCFSRVLIGSLLLGSLPVARAHAQVRLLSADEHGVTLRVEVPEATVGPPDAEGRSRLIVPGLKEVHTPGRAILPFAQTLIALPAGAGVTAQVIEGDAEIAHDGVRLVLAERPIMKDDPQGLGAVPASEPVPAIVDGPWPASPVEVGAPFTLRHQRLVAVRIQPWRYDETARRWWSHRTLTVRVVFSGATSRAGSVTVPEDRHWEPILRNTVLNYEQGRSFRITSRTVARPRSSIAAPRVEGVPGTNAAAFDEDQPEVRVRVDTTGVYGIEYDQLALQGYPADVPTDQVSVHRHEFVPDANPPYVTIDVPIEVVDVNTNNVFDSGDYIEVFVQNWAERSGASLEQRLWGDAEVVYATRLTSHPVLRMPTRPGWLNQSLTPLTAYPWTQRWERNFYYMNAPDDTTLTDRFLWTDIVPYYARPDTVQFQINGIDTTHAVTVTATWQGRRNGVPHIVWAQVRNGSGQVTSITDSTQWFGKNSYSAVANLTGSAISEGNTNSLRMYGKGSFAAPDPLLNAFASASLNWFDVAYWRRYRALNGYLPASSADAVGAFQIHATGFSSTDIRVYDVTDPTQPVRLDVDATHIAPGGGGTFTIDFQDSAAPGAPRRYFIVDSPHVLPPDHYTAVTRRNLAGSGAGDYLLVVPEAFMSAAVPLVALHQAQGMSVVLAPLESVNDEFNGGRPSKYSIKRFVRYALDNWNARFLLLLGDGSEDGRHVFNDAGIDWIPAPMIRGPVSQPDGGLEIIPSDPWYAWCFDQEESNFYFSTPPIPELFVGRLPANTLQQAVDMVTKAVDYENLSTDLSWRRRMLLLADDAYSGATTFGGGGGGSGYCYRDYELKFRTLNQAVRSVIVNDAGLKLCQADVLDLRSYLTTPSLYIINGPGDTCRTGTDTGTPNAKSILASTFNPELFSRLNAGVLWWNFQGHANQYVLSHERFYENSAGSQSRDFLLNDGKPFLFSAFSCHANGFAKFNENDPSNGPSIGENLLTLPRDRGAIASWASTGYEVIPSSPSYHLNVEMARAMFSQPPHDDLLANGDHSARVVLGEALEQTLIEYLPTVASYSFERGVGLTYNLLGDPASRLSIGPPQMFVTANGQTVNDGEPVRLTSQGDTLRIEADLVSNVSLSSISLERTDATGTHVLAESLYTLTPAFPDTDATGAGGRAYHLSYFTSLSNGAFRFTIRTVDRYGVPAKFDIVFEFQTVLEAEDVPLKDDDPVAATARLTLLVLSPNTLDPQTDLTLFIDGAPQAFTAAPLRGDVSGRQFVLSWTHPPYAAGRHEVRLDLSGTQAAIHTFQVVGGVRFQNAMAFPNPFEDELGTRFSFELMSDSPADVLIRVYTAAGHLVYDTSERNLLPGYHQLPWDGRDAEGQRLANGIYFYRMVAKSASSSTVYEGRLVKLRKPHRVAEPTAGP